MPRDRNEIETRVDIPNNFRHHLWEGHLAAEMKHALQAAGALYRTEVFDMRAEKERFITQILCRK